MLDLKVAISGLSAAELARAGHLLPRAIEDGVKGVMKNVRARMVNLATSQLHRRTGGTFQNLRSGRITAKVSSNLITGKYSHRAFFLNIFDKGGIQPAMQIKPKKKAMKFAVKVRGGISAGKKKAFRTQFVRGSVQIPQRILAARPVTKRALVGATNEALAMIERVTHEVVESSRLPVSTGGA
jgi:hypothetical protein